MLTCYTLPVQHEDYEEWKRFTHAHLTDPENLAGKMRLPPSRRFLPFALTRPAVLVHHLNLAPSYLPTLPTPPPSLSPISVSVTPARPAPSPPRYLGSRSRKVKPPRHLMDENGIKMKAHFRIMKMCGGRLGELGRLPRCRPN